MMGILMQLCIKMAKLLAKLKKCSFWMQTKHGCHGISARYQGFSNKMRDEVTLLSKLSNQQDIFS